MRGPFRRFIHAGRRLAAEAIVETGDAAAAGMSAVRGEGVAGGALEDATYQLLVGSILVRNPLVLRPLTEFEAAYEQYQGLIQQEKARGVFDILTTQRQELAKLGDSSRETAVPEFPLDPAYVAADDNEQSLMRRLERKLYMVVQDERGEWRFPVRRVWNAERPLHLVCRQLVEESVGTECEVYHVGRAPVAHFVDTMPDRLAPPFGTKVD